MNFFPKGSIVNKSLLVQVIACLIQVEDDIVSDISVYVFPD